MANAKCYAWNELNQQTSSKTKNVWQVGIIASTVVADKTTLWGSATTSSDLTNYEVGIGYEFNPGWELNVNYRDLRVKDVRLGGGSGEFKEKGMGFGITHKF